MAEEQETVSFKLRPADVPRMIFTYKNKKDFFRKFHKKLTELRLPIGKLYWADYEGERTPVRTANDIFKAVENICCLNLYYLPTGDSLELFPASSDVGEEQNDEETAQKNVHNTCPLSQGRRAYITFHSYDVPRIFITYEDKKDLFEKFIAKLEELHLKRGEFSWTNRDKERILIRTADDLISIVGEHKYEWNNNKVKLYYRCIDDIENSSTRRSHKKGKGGDGDKNAVEIPQLSPT